MCHTIMTFPRIDPNNQEVRRYERKVTKILYWDFVYMRSTFFLYFMLELFYLELLIMN